MSEDSIQWICVSCIIIVLCLCFTQCAMQVDNNSTERVKMMRQVEMEKVKKDSTKIPKGVDK